MRKKYVLFLAILIAAGSGCSKHSSEEAQLSLLKTTNPSPSLIEKNTKEEMDLVESIEHDIESIKELYDVAVVKGKKETLVAYKVKHLQRFHMKKIEKKMNKMLEDKYPDEDFIVSSDYKIFLEAVELHEKMKDPDFSDKEANKKFKKIIELKKELT